MRKLITIVVDYSTKSLGRYVPLKNKRLGKYKNGINGAFSGKIGNVVGASSHGVNYMRSTPDIKIDKPTPAQQVHREKFGMVSSWFKPLKSTIEVGLQHHKGAKTPMNLAISLNFKHALVVRDHRAVIDFSRVILSMGELFISVVIEVITAVQRKISIKWVDAGVSILGNADDKATFIVYNEHKNKFVTFTGVAKRGDGQASLQLPVSFSGELVHCWMQYVSAKGDQVSSTVYVGAIEVL